MSVHVLSTDSRHIRVGKISRFDIIASQVSLNYELVSRLGSSSLTQPDFGLEHLKHDTQNYLEHLQNHLLRDTPAEGLSLYHV